MSFPSSSPIFSAFTFPPPNTGNLERNATEQSYISDITDSVQYESTAGGNATSTLEYSESSDELRDEEADLFFRQCRYKSTDDIRSGSSSFRVQDMTLSSRVVQFPSDQNIRIGGGGEHDEHDVVNGNQRERESFLMNDDNKHYHASDDEDDDHDPRRQWQMRKRHSSPRTHAAAIGEAPTVADTNATTSNVIGDPSPHVAWMTQWAYAFRSPAAVTRHRKNVLSSNYVEYPHHQNHAVAAAVNKQNMVLLKKSGGRKQESTGSESSDDDLPIPPQSTSKVLIRERSDDSLVRPPTPIHEQSPLIASNNHKTTPTTHSHKKSSTGSATKQRYSLKDGQHTDSNISEESLQPPACLTRDHAVAIASCFLMDYEAGRPPSLCATDDIINITEWQVKLHRIRFSWPYEVFGRQLALLTLFASSAMEHDNVCWVLILNLYAIVIFILDLWIRNQLRNNPHPPTPKSHHHPHYEFDARSNKNAGSLAGGASSHAADNPYSSAAAAAVYQGRESRSERLVQPMIVFLAVLGMESLGWFIAYYPNVQFTSYGNNNNTDVWMISSVFKPMALFYVSTQARDALEALGRIAKTVIRVLILELFLILSFAAVACRLFSRFERFRDLSTAWLSLFELSTTVVNPSIWMPMYQSSRTSAIFFIFFIVTSVFYLHSLVLSVVFQTYIQAATEIHERSISDREDTVRLAYVALQSTADHPEVYFASLSTILSTDVEDQKSSSKTEQRRSYKSKRAAAKLKRSSIGMTSVRSTLERTRPHYGALKINALVEIVDPSHHHVIDFTTFATKIRQALNASVRTARTISRFSMGVELLAILMAAVNFVYVILLTSRIDSSWLDSVAVGSWITILGLLEVIIRLNPMRMLNFSPITRLDATFDGLAILAGVISCVGIARGLFGMPWVLEYILMGRAIDMIRIMRFSSLFRDVVRRSAHVLPVLVGPVVLVATTLHVFTYLGMALWAGTVDVDAPPHDNITPLYNLNNFNSYKEGLVTMFQILVVNDWHAIAQVFLVPDDDGGNDLCSSPYVVYPFFVLGNLIGVSIMLNVLTAFFVEAFVTKLSDPYAGEGVTMASAQEVRISTSSQRTSKAENSLRDLANREHETITEESQSPSLLEWHGSHAHADEAVALDTDDSGGESSGLDINAFQEFDVYEREGFDKIMRTVAGGGSELSQEDFGQRLCQYLEVFESLTPGREKVGYLVCCQQTLSRFGNRRFQKKAKGFVDEKMLHVVVGDMHAELLALSATSRGSFGQDRSLVRTFPHKRDPAVQLEISASVLRRHPAVSLFVSRVTPVENATTTGVNTANARHASSEPRPSAFRGSRQQNHHG